MDLPGHLHSGVFQTPLPGSRLGVEVASPPFGVAVEGKPRECGPCGSPVASLVHLLGWKCFSQPSPLPRTGGHC